MKVGANAIRPYPDRRLRPPVKFVGYLILPAA